MRERERERERERTRKNENWNTERMRIGTQRAKLIGKQEYTAQDFNPHIHVMEW